MTVVYARLALLLLSYWGYYRALCVWIRMERTFIPLFVLSLQAVLIFLAGRPLPGRCSRCRRTGPAPGTPPGSGCIRWPASCMAEVLRRWH